MKKLKKTNQHEQKFKFQNELIIQHNNLIESRYRLSLQEKRLIIFLMSKIRLNDKNLNVITTNIRELATIIEVGSSHLYRDMIRVTKNLVGRVLSIRDLDENSLLQIPWIASSKYNYGKGTLTLKISEELVPYLLKIGGNFTAIRTSDLMKLKSIYSIRIFELLYQYKSIGQRYFDLENLKASCGISEDQHRKISDLKKYVLDMAKREINEKTDIFISYELSKTARKFTGITFFILSNPNYEKTYIEKHIKEKQTEIMSELKTRDNLVKNIIELGFSKSTVLKMIDHLNNDEVNNALSSVHNQIERGKVLNPKAMMRTALKERWAPDIFFNKNKQD